MSAKYVLVKIKKEGSMSYRVYRVKKRIKMNCPPLYCIISKNEDEIKFTYNKNEINDNQQWYEITIGIDEDLYHYLYSYAGKNLRL